MEYGLNNVTIHSQNLGLILRLVLTEGICARNELAKRAGLSKMTISNLVGELIENDILEEKAIAGDGKKGRPGQELSLSAKAPKILALYFGHSSFVASLSSLSGVTIKEVSKTIPDNVSEGSFDDVFASVDDILRTSINERIHGFSISYDSCKFNQNFFGDLSEKLKARYDLETFAAEQNKCAVLIESFYGNAKGNRNVIYVDIDQEIGSGIVLNGSLLEGGFGLEPSLGHVSIDYNGLSCSCGNRGCLQAYISTTAMEKKLQDITKLKTDFKGFCDLQQKKNDARLDWAFKDMMDKLGFALISLTNILNLEQILIGGKGANLPERYLSKLEKLVSSKRIHDSAPLAVKKAAYFDHSCAAGAISPILVKVFIGQKKLY